MSRLDKEDSHNASLTFPPTFMHLQTNKLSLSSFSSGVNVSIHRLLALSSFESGLAHLNTFASHANITESRAVALVATQLLN